MLRGQLGPTLGTLGCYGGQLGYHASYLLGDVTIAVPAYFDIKLLMESLSQHY